MDQIRLEVKKNNENARRFYEQHGFFCEYEGRREDSLYMRKLLDDGLIVVGGGVYDLLNNHSFSVLVA